MEYLEPRRKCVRLPGYDYRRPGAYFVTVCTRDRQSVLGEIVDREMRCNPLGRLVGSCWQAIPSHFPHVNVDAFVVMPNHVHGVLVFADIGVEYIRPLHVVVATFKAAVSREAGPHVWQRNYYEHIIRDEKELNSVRHYIDENPLRWPGDNRDRGKPRGSAPPTPPYMRVRIRRFRDLSR